MLGNIRAKYNFTDNFDLTAFYSIQYENDLRSQYFSSKTRFAGGSGQNGRANKFTEDRENELFEVTANYQKILMDLKFRLLGGYSWQQFVLKILMHSIPTSSRMICSIMRWNLVWELLQAAMPLRV